ncbi:hypothetical protein F4678DRAFT_476648 [Xylaria arbuscula]|nr:hypothetical protein F4678DRAFT_476648 [Xylaria arbuscula]
MNTQEPSGQQGLLVIHVALFRMGTQSFAEAYRTLGYKFHHGVEDVRGNPWVLIERAVEATWPSIPGATPRQPFTRQDWDSLWGSKYEIVTDMGSPFVHQLVKAYPNANVVVVQRDFDSWWPSFSSQLLDTLFNPLAIRKVHFGFFGAKNREEIEANSREAYDKYYDALRQMVPPERRLEYRLGDGWEPSCTLLEKDVPDNEAVRKTTKKVASWVFMLARITAAIWYIQ